jgi:hypothetical protein
VIPDALARVRIEQALNDFVFDLAQLTQHTEELFTDAYVRQSQMPEPDGERYVVGIGRHVRVSR